MTARWFWNSVATLFDGLVVPSFGAPGFRVRRRLWDDPGLAIDLRGHTFVVTGANAGIGRATTAALFERGATVHMVCRDEERGREAREALVSESASDGASADTGSRLHLHLADVSSLAAVRRLVDTLRPALPDGLNGLVHNAGVLLHEPTFTDDGLETTFATHVAGPFLLTYGLAPALETAARRGTAARVVFVSSGGMYTQKLDVDTLARGPAPYDGLVAYAQAKRAQVLLAHRWQEHLDAVGVTTASMHPGWADTGGVRRSLPRFRAVLRPILRDARQAADTAVWLAASPEASDAGGGFFFDRTRRREHIPLRRTGSERADIDRLWALLEKACGLDAAPHVAPEGGGRGGPGSNR